MRSPSLDGSVTAELLVRRDLPDPSRRRVDAIDARLDSLATDGKIQTYRRQTWPKRLRVTRCDDLARDRYLAFTAWAADKDVSLQPFFHTRERYCTEAGTYTDCIVVPAMTLAVTVDDGLASVYPHSDEDGTVAIEDGVVTLYGDEAEGDDEPVAVAD